jgi:hypothetical protein
MSDSPDNNYDNISLWLRKPPIHIRSKYLDMRDVPGADTGPFFLEDVEDESIQDIHH